MPNKHVPELSETVDNMLSEDSKLRLKAERDQLAIRLVSLIGAIVKAKSGMIKVSARTIHLWEAQRTVMRCYLDILDVRAIEWEDDIIE